jgi:Na+/proline symporter
MGYEMVTGDTLNLWQQLDLHFALTAITALTALYRLGQNQTVVWTDVIQACIMFGSLGFAIWSLLHAIPDGWQNDNSSINPETGSFLERGRCSRSFPGNVRSI